MPEVGDEFWQFENGLVDDLSRKSLIWLLCVCLRKREEKFCEIAIFLSKPVLPNSCPLV
ncbi:hypothetical protein SLEP1_g17515 [Rubroshorea leprosula]|uniref:Uncharacterized protein n=1 Tax=Rubroshorea leprosula TaxID=152421 RepID=A0AAV5J521_9ROSI|nr:hypothetical protein SLEP1_g17515 [Rubroshorea leprosula]